MGVLDNLNIIKSCKEDIKQAIADKGVDMTNVAFTEYATKISEIQAGGGSGDYLDMRANMSTYYSTAESVPNYAFAYCNSLQSVNLPMCSYVGEYAFAYCNSLQSVNLPMCMKINAGTFTNCKSLQSVDLPMCISVGYSAFSYCSSLQSVNLPMCFDIGGSAFASCSLLSVLDLRSTYSCVLATSKAFSRTPFASGIGSIYVHAAHLSQFQNATNWTYFSKCLVGVGDPTRLLLSFDSGRVYGDTVIIYSNYSKFLSISKSNITSIDLPNCVTITSNCFNYCSSLQSVNLPNCESIVSSTFEGCSSLQSVNLPMCSYVGEKAFAYCKSLQSIDLPMCESVGENCFCNCFSLSTINLQMCEYAGDKAFQDCQSLQSIDLPMCSYVGSNCFWRCESLTEVNLPMCSYVGSNAFESCTSLQTVNLPMCEYVGNLAFYTYNNTIDTVYIGTSISKVCQAGGPQIFAANNTQGGYFVKSIFVPMSLVDAYKSAQYWSVYASLIYGI